MECSYLVDGEPCGKTGEPYSSFAVCEEHKLEVQRRKQVERRSTALQSAKHHDPLTFPGKCYVALLPDSTVKIGYSNTKELLENRFKSLSRDYGAPVVPLLVTEGGFVQEAVLHDQFDHLRLSGPGERFEYGPEIAEYVGSKL